MNLEALIEMITHYLYVILLFNHCGFPPLFTKTEIQKSDKHIILMQNWAWSEFQDGTPSSGYTFRLNEDKVAKYAFLGN